MWRKSIANIKLQAYECTGELVSQRYLPQRQLLPRIHILIQNVSLPSTIKHQGGKKDGELHIRSFSFILIEGNEVQCNMQLKQGKQLVEEVEVQLYDAVPRISWVHKMVA